MGQREVIHFHKGDCEVIEGLVSTIIPVYNRPALLRRAVASVLAQTYCHIEIIIVDDGSTDGTAETAGEMAQAHPDQIRVIRQKNAGPGAARETGRVMARGEFIQYLDSDDLVLPEKFERQVAGLRANPECGVSYGKTRHHQLPPDVPWKQTGEKLEAMFPAFLRQRCWSTPTPLYRRTVSDLAGPWTRLSQEEDWEYDCRVAALGTRLHYCDYYIAEIGTDGASSLSSRWRVDPAMLRDRVTAHTLIFACATSWGMRADAPEMQHFARELFLLSRQCGAAGLSNESRELFALAKTASGENRARGWDFRFYKLFASILGWSAIGRLVCYSDDFRK